MNDFLELKNLVNSLDEDARKFYGNGNQAAGTRLRKGLLQVKAKAGALKKAAKPKS